jgi:hypothetical protein
MVNVVQVARKLCPSKNSIFIKLRFKDHGTFICYQRKDRIAATDG